MSDEEKARKDEEKEKEPKDGGSKTPSSPSPTDPGVINDPGKSGGDGPPEHP